MLLMDKELKQVKEHYKEHYFDEEISTRIKNKVHHRVREDKKKWSLRKKAACFSSVAVLLFALLIGSAYLSPSIAKVVAKVPYFSLFIKQEEYKHALYDVIIDAIAINEKGYELRSLDASVPKREITLSIAGSKENINSIKDNVIKNINAALVDQNFGEYDIEVKRYKEMKGKGDAEELSPKIKQYIKDSKELEAKIIKQLKKHNYTLAFSVQVRINDIEKYIFVAVPKTEKRISELKDLLHSTSSDFGKFRLDIRTIDMAARKQEIRWGKNNIVSILVSGLMANKDFKVTGFSYSFHPLPLQIKIETSLNASDPHTKEVVNEIEKAIKYFIQHHEKTKEVRNDPYEITIYGKDKKKIN
jgi:DNA-binding cell septation regulator SpoVG